MSTTWLRRLLPSTSLGPGAAGPQRPFFPGELWLLERRPRGLSPPALERDGRRLVENPVLEVRRPGFHVYAFERANELLSTTVSQNRILLALSLHKVVQVECVSRM